MSLDQSWHTVVHTAAAAQFSRYCMTAAAHDKDCAGIKIAVLVPIQQKSSQGTLSRFEI
jgi:hypothetical protein